MKRVKIELNSVEIMIISEALACLKNYHSEVLILPEVIEMVEVKIDKYV